MVVLLTATINPRQTAYVARRDPSVRLNDYRKALVLWLHDRGGQKLVFCENSSHDLVELERACQSNNPYGKEVEFLSFEGNNFLPQRGKGPGELAIIGYALNQSRLIKNDAQIMKVTGRLYVKNTAEIIRQIEAQQGTEIFCDLRAGLTYGDSRIFCTSARFLKTYLIPMQELADDSKNIYMEHLLGRAVHRAMADGVTWAMMPLVPDLCGISGTGGIAYRRFLPERIVRQILQKVKSFAFSQ